MIILAIDPGITTGVALVSGDNVLYSGDLEEKDLQSLIGTSLKATHIVIERLPASTTGTLGRSLARITGVLATMFPDAKLVDPGVWKPVTAQIPLPKQLTSRHQGDAYRISQWFQRSRP